MRRSPRLLILTGGAIFAILLILAVALPGPSQRELHRREERLKTLHPLSGPSPALTPFRFSWPGSSRATSRRVRVHLYMKVGWLNSALHEVPPLIDFRGLAPGGTVLHVLLNPTNVEEVRWASALAIVGDDAVAGKALLDYLKAGRMAATTRSALKDRSPATVATARAAVLESLAEAKNQRVDKVIYEVEGRFYENGSSASIHALTSYIPLAIVESLSDPRISLP